MKIRWKHGAKETDIKVDKKEWKKVDFEDQGVNVKQTTTDSEKIECRKKGEENPEKSEGVLLLFNLRRRKNLYKNNQQIKRADRL